MEVGFLVVDNCNTSLFVLGHHWLFLATIDLLDDLYHVDEIITKRKHSNRMHTTHFGGHY